VADYSHRLKPDSKVTKITTNGLIDALHVCFKDHHPFTLSVSDIINAIGQGLGKHVNKNAEKLRDQFVNHQGKQEIYVDRPSFDIDA